MWFICQLLRDALLRSALRKRPAESPIKNVRPARFCGSLSVPGVVDASDLRDSRCFLVGLRIVLQRAESVVLRRLAHRPSVPSHVGEGAEVNFAYPYEPSWPATPVNVVLAFVPIV